MDHEKCQLLLADYAVMGLSQGMAKAVEMHLRECEECSAHMDVQLDLLEMGKAHREAFRPAPASSPGERVSGWLHGLTAPIRSAAAIPLPIAAAILLGLLAVPLYLKTFTIPALEAKLSSGDAELKTAQQTVTSLLGEDQVLVPATRERPNTITVEGVVTPLRLPLKRPEPLEGMYAIELSSANGTTLAMTMTAEDLGTIWNPTKGLQLKLPSVAFAPGPNTLVIRKVGDPALYEIAFVANRR